MHTHKEVVEVIARGLIEKRTIIFCGAGVSRNSGLPMAIPLLSGIMVSLGVPADDMRVLIGSDSNHLPLPFEVYVEELRKNGSIDWLANLYQQGEPNRNHRFFAKLMKQGLVQTIITTNFDLLIEEALQAEGMKEGKDFDVLYNDEHFRSVNWSKKRGRLIKIHGCASNVDSIAITLQQIVARTGVESRYNIIKHVFADGDQQANILVLGYSCSDIFDISPQIESLGPLRKGIWIVNNCNNGGVSVIPINEIVGSNPFYRCTEGWQVSVQTDSLIQDLWSATLGDTICEIGKRNIDVKQLILRWVSSLGNEAEIVGQLLPGTWFSDMGEYRSAIRYYERALELARKSNNRKTEVVLLLNLSYVCMSVGEYDSAMAHVQSVLQFSAVNDNRQSRIWALMRAGDILEKKGAFVEAANHYRQAVEHLRETDQSFVDMAGLLQKYGVTLIRSGQFQAGMNSMKHALEMARFHGLKQTEGICLGGLGCACKDLADYEHARDYLQQAIKIADLLGDKMNKGTWLGNLGSVFQKIGDHPKAIQLYISASEIAVEIGDLNSESAWIANIGISYKELGKYSQALESYERALALDRKIENQYGIGTVLSNKGNIYLEMGNPELARECFVEALRIAQVTGDRQGEAFRQRGLAVVNELAGDIPHAIECYQKAITLFQFVLGPSHPLSMQVELSLHKLMKMK